MTVILFVMIFFILSPFCIDILDNLLYQIHTKGYRWVKMKRYRPIKNGWYLCSVRYDIEDETLLNDDLCFTYPAILYWKNGIFVDVSRQSVFNNYAVYSKEKELSIKDTEFIMPDFQEAEITDDYCDLTEHVIAWRMEPLVWKDSSKTNIIFKGANRQFYNKTLRTEDLLEEMDNDIK